MEKFDDIPRNIGRLIAEHTALYLSEPERAHLWDATPVGVPGVVPTLLLTTTGRRSGQPRHVPLLYVPHGSGYLVIGSKGGSATAPTWFLNLAEQPKCEIRVAALRAKARARVLSGPERADTWVMVTARYPIYLKYQARTDRQFPVIVLEPVAT